MIRLNKMLLGERGLGKNSFLCTSLLVTIALMSSSFMASVQAVIPEVRNVIVYDVAGSTLLNVTVYHIPQDSSHYVSKIQVSIGSNITDVTIPVQSLRPDSTFVITYDVGPVSDTPMATVDAYCTVNGWASSAGKQWAGQIPEFSTSALLLAMLLGTLLATVAVRKARRQQ